MAGTDAGQIRYVRAERVGAERKYVRAITRGGSEQEASVVGDRGGGDTYHHHHRSSHSSEYGHVVR